jgi:hypothetical protein
MSNAKNSNSALPSSSPILGRNEPCPCGSRKKYKRCCGVSAAPKLTRPASAGLGDSLAAAGGDLGGADSPGGAGMSGGFGQQNPFESISPELMTQMTQALSRLPKSQLQRFQTLMQKAMSGRDITREAKEFERTLPPEFKTLMQTLAASAGFNPAAAIPPGDSPGGALLPAPGEASEAASGELTEEQARQLVAQAAAEGKISSDQAKELLEGSAPSLDQAQQTPQEASGSTPPVAGESESRFKKFWKSFSG